MLKNKPANARDARDVGSVPGLGTSPEEENGNTLLYSCLGNPRDCKELDRLHFMGLQGVRHNLVNEHTLLRFMGHSNGGL